MKKKNLPDDLEPSCRICEYCTVMEATGEFLCKYKNSLKKIDENDLCKKFSFDIFAYKPKPPALLKAFDFSKI
ncbi:MAG: hypothetical protein DBX61_06010 [Clostridiales bacterium]|nr:MAG: hypothetical protein DBX61_06010 [Clostridiales bacterium]